MAIAAGQKVKVTVSHPVFDYHEGDIGTVKEIDLKGSTAGPVMMAFVEYDGQEPGWVHVENLVAA